MRPLYRVVASTALAGTGIKIVKIALPAHLTLLSFDPADVGLLTAALAAGWPLLGLIAGLTLDHFNRSHILIAGIAVALAATLVLLVLSTTADVALFLLCFWAFAISSGEVLTETSGPTLLPETVDQAALPQANRLNEGATTLGLALVAPLAATAFLEISVAASLILAAVIIATAIFVGVPRSRNNLRTRRALSIRQLFGGALYISDHPTLCALTVLFIGMTICWGGWTVLIVLYVLSSDGLALNAIYLGILLSSVGVGSLIGSLLFSRIWRALGTRWLLGADLIGTFAFLAVPAMGLGFAPTLAACAIAGMGGVLWMISVSAYQQAVTPDALLGRVIATYRWFRWTGFLIGSLVAGPLVEVAGLQVAIGAFAIAAFVVACAYPILLSSTNDIDAVMPNLRSN